MLDHLSYSGSCNCTQLSSQHSLLFPFLKPLSHMQNRCKYYMYSHRTANTVFTHISKHMYSSCCAQVCLSVCRHSVTVLVCLPPLHDMHGSVCFPCDYRVTTHPHHCMSSRIIYLTQRQLTHSYSMRVHMFLLLFQH